YACHPAGLSGEALYAAGNRLLRRCGSGGSIGQLTLRDCQRARQAITLGGQGLGLARESRAFGLELLALCGQSLVLFGTRLLTRSEILFRGFQLCSGFVL